MLSDFLGSTSSFSQFLHFEKCWNISEEKNNSDRHKKNKRKNLWVCEIKLKSSVFDKKKKLMWIEFFDGISTIQVDLIKKIIVY